MRFCKNFAEHELALAEEIRAREDAERDARQLRTRLVYAVTATLLMALLLTASTVAGRVETVGVLRRRPVLFRPVLARDKNEQSAVEKSASRQQRN